MKRSSALASLGIVAGAAGAATTHAFMKDLKDRKRELDDGSKVAMTTAGPIEYAEEGSGPVAFAIHGAGGGHDQGMSIGRDMVGATHQLIAPSRFGYLRTPLPDDASPAAQADAHAALMDSLNIRTAVVIGASAGAPSAVELALRHPQRVSHLILLVPRLHCPEQAVEVRKGGTNDVVMDVVMGAADFGFWVASKVARRWVVRFLAVPPEVEAAAAPEERQRISALIRSILPLSARAAGLRADSEAEIGPVPLENILTPTLVISAIDDLYGTLPAARHAARRIPGARLKVFETGGHLLVSRGDEVRHAVADFLNSRQSEALAA